MPEDRMDPRATAAALGALALDAALVVAFAAVGRLSHREAVDLAGMAITVWPFLVGLLLGWVVARAWRSPGAVWPTGVVVWAVTVSGGMVLRVVSGQGVAVAFVVVAASTIALFLIGWRVIAGLAARARRSRTSAG